MPSVIEAKDLHFAYVRVPVLEGISFSIQAGDYVGLIGPNGGGKTTLLKLLLGLEKGQGEIKLFGQPLARFKDWQKIGYLAQKSPVAQSGFPISAEEVVLMGLPGRVGSGVGVAELKQVYDAMQKTHTREYASRIFSDLSIGQQQRVLLARALVSHPELLILDEPTTGLDPQTRKTLWEVIETLRKRDKMTVFLTTHYMEEVADADYVVILDAGKISAEGTPLELKNKYTGDFITVYNADELKVAALGKKYEVIRDACRISVKDTAEARDLIIKNPDLFSDFEITKGKMDDVFLAVTGKKLAGEN